MNQTFFARLRGQLVGQKPKQRDLLAAAAAPAAIRIGSLMGATEQGLKELGESLEDAGLHAEVREVAKVAELHRLCAARFTALLRRLGEGS